MFVPVQKWFLFVKSLLVKKKIKSSELPAAHFAAVNAKKENVVFHKRRI